MSDSTVTETAETLAAADEQAAKAALDALEQAAEDGHPVKAAQLVEARERLRLAPRIRRGIEQRAAERRQREAEAARAAAKAAAVPLVADIDTEMLAAYDEALSALQALIDTAGTYNEALAAVERLYSGAGVPQRSAWAPASEIEGFDRENFVSMDQGLILRNVTVAGKLRERMQPSEWVLDVVARVARANRGLPVDYSDSIQTRIGASRALPPLLREHYSA